MLPVARLGIDQADNGEVKRVESAEGYCFDFKLPHHGPVFTAADHPFEGDDGFLSGFHQEQVPQGVCGRQRIRVGMIVSDDENW